MNFKPIYRPRNLLIIGIILNPVIVILLMVNPNLNIPIISSLSNIFIVIGILLWLVNKYDGTDYDYEEEYEND